MPCIVIGLYYQCPFFFLGGNLPFGFIFLLFPIKVAEVCAQSRAQKKLGQAAPLSHFACSGKNVNHFVRR